MLSILLINITGEEGYKKRKKLGDFHHFIGHVK